MQSFICR